MKKQQGFRSLAVLLGKTQQAVTKKTAIVLCLYFLVISVLELLAYRCGGVASIIASRIWMFTGVFLLFAFVYQCVLRLKEDFRDRRVYLPVGALLLLAFYSVLIFSSNYGDVNPDAAQQLAAGLSSFSESDWNYTGTAFLGYANRQYLLGALPALLLGRSIATLHLGFGLLYLIGLSELFFEFRSWLKQYGQREEFALLPVFSLFGFRFLMEYFMNFEQAITPVALTMLGIALFLRVVRKADAAGMVSLAWVGCLCCDSYTPVLASMALLVGFLALYLLSLCLNNGRGTSRKQGRTVSDQGERWALPAALAAVDLNIVCFFAATLLGGRSDRIDEVREGISLFSYVKECIIEFFTDKNAVFLGFFAGIVLLYIVLSFTGQLKAYDVLLSVWVLAVIVAANYMVGYTSYSKAWILQRAMIVIPVLVTGIFFAGARLLREYAIRPSKRLLSVFLALFLVLGAAYCRQPHQSFVYFSYIKPMKYMFQLTQELCKEEKIRATDEFNLVLYTDNLFQTNLHDYCTFLYPNAHTYVPEAGTFPDGMDPALPTIVFGETPEFAALYSANCEERRYFDVRYQCEHVWYVVVP